MHKIIVGLTSTPPRINSITPTLLALANQKLKPDEIVLSIPKVSARFGVPYEITNPDILKLVANGTVIINVIDHDYGPATKVVGLLYRNYDPNDLLVWLDDDIQYGPLVLQCLRERIEPHNAVSFSGFNFGKNNSFVLPDLKKVKHNDKFDIIEGFATMATLKKNTPRLQDLELYNIRPQTNESLKTISKKERIQFLSDDFTISQFFKKNNIKMNVLNQDFCHKDKSNNIKVLKLGLRADALHKQTKDVPTDEDTNWHKYRYLLSLENIDDEFLRSTPSQSTVTVTTVTVTVVGSMFVFLLIMCILWLLLAR